MAANNICPPIVTTYIVMHMDSIGKILNHTLWALVVLNTFLFFASFGVGGFLDHMGFSTVMVAFLLCVQPTCVLLIVNNNRLSSLSILAPTDCKFPSSSEMSVGLASRYFVSHFLVFSLRIDMIGVAFGITVGATILSYFLHTVYAGVNCGNPMVTTYSDLCLTHRGTLNGVWFWSGLVCFGNAVCALLIAYGRHELAQNSPSHSSAYESVGENAPMTMADYEQHIRNQDAAAQAQFSSGTPPPAQARPAFVGDYSSVPEIRDGIVSP
jgi:hypothetical protein